MQRWVFAVAGLLAGLMAISSPSAEPLVSLRRLPPVEAPVLPDALPTEPLDKVLFAAGSVEITPPAGWWIQEVPVGREVRLCLGVEPPTTVRRLPREGLWLTYHAGAATADTAELAAWLDRRLQLATRNTARSTEPVEFQLGPWRAMVVEFVSARRHAQDDTLRGRHLAVQTDWGVLELHSYARQATFDEHRAAMARVWETMTLRSPESRQRIAELAVSDAEPILGSWKSYRGRLRLDGDGRVTIVPDSQPLLTDDSTGVSKVLTGTFHARDDILYVEWDDGSLLNFRWRARDNDLFLTDHEGQLSQLKRLLE